MAVKEREAVCVPLLRVGLYWQGSIRVMTNRKISENIHSKTEEVTLT